MLKTLTYLLLIFFSFSTHGEIIYNKTDSELLDREMLLKIFTKKQKFWSDGSKIVVFVKPVNSIEHKYFVTEWLGITHSKYKTMLDGETFSGSASNVNVVKSDDEMLISIAQTPNSIGYIDNKIILRGNKDVKVISTM